jgi:MFS family permease
MVDLAPQAALQTDAAAKPSIRRYYVLGLLTVIYALNFLDRTIFNVLIEPIKKEFALSDTTMGLLAGFGFVLFYSVLGIPIARLADRFNRRNIVAVALAFWSAMTVFCGMAQSVATLALARIGVGIGESGGTPASQSIIADLFSKNERPRALGVYAIGTYLGVFLGYFIGGYVNQYYGWRMAFYTAGLPGIALAAVLWLTISEPKRGAMAETFTPEPIGPTLGFLASQRTFVILLVGFCLTTYPTTRLRPGFRRSWRGCIISPAPRSAPMLAPSRGCAASPARCSAVLSWPRSAAATTAGSCGRRRSRQASRGRCSRCAC